MPETSAAPNGSPDKPYIGGQAVIEGVMMRSPASFAIAVRRADGSIDIRERPVSKKASAAAKIPLLRGVATLVESLRLGSEALRFSAERMELDLGEEEEAPKSKGKGAGLTQALSLALKSFGVTLANLATLGMRADGEPSGGGEDDGRSANGMAILTLVMVLFLIALPQALAYGTQALFRWDIPVDTARFQLLTGAFKLIVVVGYLGAIRRVAEIRRVFQYHGAEHKTISTYEAGEALTVPNAKAKTTLHPRCGTTFLVLTVLVSIVVWTALTPLMPKVAWPGWQKQLVFFLIKLPFLPVLAAITFELQRFTARYCLTGPLRALLWPGFLIQKITTIEPDDDQLEIALASMRATLWREKVGTEVATDAAVVSFDNYEAVIAAEAIRAA
jgi:uncharacterized protein YqhQ